MSRETTPSDPSPTVVTSAAAGPATKSPSVGTTMGRYVVLEEIGRGGMGRVLRAYDPKLQREVALKEVRGDVLGDEGTLRLVGEARAMAKLSHPNVVGVYDAEQIDEDHVVLVMEYVAGETLRKWLKGHARAWSEIVRKFREAGRGLAAAHAADVLHRDFKPANVLVSDDGVAKVTDFGLAKLGGDASSASLDAIAPTPNPLDVAKSSSLGTEGLTEAGVVLGTPRYMAPEQHFGGPLTPAVDQYAFCIALWEALAGAPPFSPKRIGEAKLQGPPPWPGGPTPRPIADAIRRGLEPGADDRWPDMNALLEALAHDPAARRKRWLLGLGAVLGLGAGALTWQAWVQRRAARCTGSQQQLDGVWDETRRAEMREAILGLGPSYAARVWERTQRELDTYATAWTAMHTEACEATTIRGEQSAAVMDLRMACLHRGAVDLDAVVRQLADADDTVIQNAHRLVGGLPPVARCADIDALRESVEPPLPAEADAVEELRARLADARADRDAGHYDRGRATLQEIRESLASLEYGPVRTEVALEEGQLFERLGRYDAAATATLEAIESASRWRQPDALASAARHAMFVIGYHLERPEEGLRYLELVEGLARGDAVAEANIANSLTAIRASQGRYEEAERQARRMVALRESALPPDSPEIGWARENLSVVLNDEGRFEEAVAESRRALALLQAALGPDHPTVATTRGNLGNFLFGCRRYDEASLELRRSLEVLEAAFRPDHPTVTSSRVALGTVLMRQGKLDEAEVELRTAIASLEKTLGPDSSVVANARNTLGVLLTEQKRYEEAEREHRRALQARETTRGPEHPDTALSHHNLGIVLEARGKFDEAEAELRRGLQVRDVALGPEHPTSTKSRFILAQFLLDRGRPEEALELARVVWDRAQSEDTMAVTRAGSALLLARALWDAQPDAQARSRARELGAQAKRELDGADVIEAAKLEAAVDAWLASTSARPPADDTSASG